MEHLAVREEKKKKSRWKNQEKLKESLLPEQSTWGFQAESNSGHDPSGVGTPLISLHAASFLVLTSQRQLRSEVLVVSFPRANLTERLIVEDTGIHAFPALDKWHRTLSSGTPSANADLARQIAPAANFHRFTRQELAPILEVFLDAGLVRDNLVDTARKLVEAAR